MIAEAQAPGVAPALCDSTALADWGGQARVEYW